MSNENACLHQHNDILPMAFHCQLCKAIIDEDRKVILEHFTEPPAEQPDSDYAPKGESDVVFENLAEEALTDWARLWSDPSMRDNPAEQESNSESENTKTGSPTDTADNRSDSMVGGIQPLAEQEAVSGERPKDDALRYRNILGEIYSILGETGSWEDLPIHLRRRLEAQPIDLLARDYVRLLDEAGRKFASYCGCPECGFHTDEAMGLREPQPEGEK